MTCVHMSLFAGHICVRPFLHARVPACRACVCVRTPILNSIKRCKTLVVFRSCFPHSVGAGLLDCIRPHSSAHPRSSSLYCSSSSPPSADYTRLLPPAVHFRSKPPVAFPTCTASCCFLLRLPPHLSFDQDPFHSSTSIAS